MPDTLTIVMAAYNMADYIAETLDSLVQQDYNEFRVIVIDDGSKDNTAKIAHSYSDRLKIEVSQIENGGVSNARNVGLNRVETGYVLFLDADDILRPDALRIFVETLDKHPEWVACSANHIKFNDRTSRLLPHENNVEFSNKERFVRDLLRRNFIVNGGAFCMSTAAAKAAGGYDTNLKLGEDREFWLRLGMQGSVGFSENFFPLWYRVRPTGANTRLRQQETQSSIDVMFANPRLTEFVSPNEIAAIRRFAKAERHWTTVRSDVKARRIAAAFKGAIIGLLKHPSYLQNVFEGLRRQRARKAAQSQT